MAQVEVLNSNPNTTHTKKDGYSNFILMDTS
jgi:hypothetical protein